MAAPGRLSGPPRPRPRRPAPPGWRLTRAVGAVTVLSLPAILFLDVVLMLVSLSLLVAAAATLAVRLAGPPSGGPAGRVSGLAGSAGGGRCDRRPGDQASAADGGGPGDDCP
ncbi:hypothetical protein ONA70_20965 [Micromonospora yasonensis]|uniref:hypothetical protein n=1 Tax=Micromonospora yasonensis TaxID=1128667 RepID=UPI0022326A09|nr:hypothetical protein [Micromonospora yasonensis]MCW3842574.1 hypothetical protein [Micromonospora yasonensis]